MENQSLHQLMENEDQKWLQSITEASDITWLMAQEKKAVNPSRKAIISARIANLNHLML